MTKIPCLYAIVQFRPFVETGEFANVGIILISPDHRFFDFKLMYTRHARVTHFFEQLDAKVFKTAIRNLRDELGEVRTLLKQKGFDRRFKVNDAGFARALFNEIVRPRETAVRFSEKRAVLAADPAATLDELFAYYVERNFVNKEYQEAILERGVRKWLHQANLADKFEAKQIGDEFYSVAFPFAEIAGHDNVVHKAIKPLNLAHAHPSRIIDHGGQWLFRIEQLRQRDALPERVLFAVSTPVDANAARRRAAQDIVEALERAKVEVVPITHRGALLDFARSS